MVVDQAKADVALEFEAEKVKIKSSVKSCSQVAKSYKVKRS